MSVPATSARLEQAADGRLETYKASMLRLLAYVGLTGYGTEAGAMPERTEAERALIHSRLAQVTREDEAKRERLKGKLWRTKKGAPNTVVEAVECASGARGDRTIYLSFEESLEWKAFLLATPPSQRHEATVRRRLCLSLWKAHCRDLCLWCWFPKRMCLCATLDELRASMPHGSLTARVMVTMVLHAEEVMRSTNSGHIAAYLLDAPIRVWGCPEDNAYLAALPATSLNMAGTVASAAAATPAPVVVHNAALYPETNADNIADFIRSLDASREDAIPVHSCNQVRLQSPPCVTSPDCVHKAHLLLFDSTWGQALSLNRHISRVVPRVALELDDEYESLFTRLRKRTREGGVSTLEATSMAVEQCIAAMGSEAEAKRVSTVLTDAMKAFVDLKCVLKFTEAEFNKDADTLDDLTTRRDEVRRQEASQRYHDMAKRLQEDQAARCLLLPPVLNYCYCCERVIGWHRMPEHVLGRTHRTNALKNPTCEPSAASRLEAVPDFERPMRRKKSPSQ